MTLEKDDMDAFFLCVGGPIGDGHVCDRLPVGGGSGELDRMGVCTPPTFPGRGPAGRPYSPFQVLLALLPGVAVSGVRSPR